jgi:hypothetical protein
MVPTTLWFSTLYFQKTTSQVFQIDGLSLHSSSVNSNLSPLGPQATHSSRVDQKRESAKTLRPPFTSSQMGVAPGVQNTPGLGALDPITRELNLIQTDPRLRVSLTETQGERIKST